MDAERPAHATVRNIMATRSRLGRDPFGDATAEANAATNRPATKATPPRNPPAKRQPAQAAGKTSRLRGTTPAVTLEGPLPDAPDAPDVEASSPQEGSVGVRHMPPAPVPKPIKPTLPALGPNPVEVFLRSALEGLVPDDVLAMSVAVDPESASLPVEKLFYLSQILQRLVTLPDRPGQPWRRTKEASDRPATLTVRLRELPGGRHCLRLYDNGLYFRSHLTAISLSLEALRPVVRFVIKHCGSILMRQGRCIEFEVIG
jgi:hypothetical protein